MIKAVLLDLDDTLLRTNMEIFIPEYLNLLGRKLNHFYPADKLIDLVLESTQIMMQNKDKQITNHEVFYHHFYNKIGIERERLQPYIDEFYNNEYKSLKRIVKPIQTARMVIDFLKRKDLKVVIATNPVFPAVAIRHRLDWAQLASFKFDLVTTLENSYATKPQTDYYIDILKILHVAPDQALMVGDDYEHDIEPAAKAGLFTYQIVQQTAEKQNQGKIKHFLAWLEEGGLQALT